VEFEVERNIRKGTVDLYVFVRRREVQGKADGMFYLTQSGEVKLPEDPGARVEVPLEPLLSIPYSSITGDLGSLMDGLWRAGFRPSDMSGTASETEAMRAHIGDLQKVAFGDRVLAVEDVAKLADAVKRELPR